MGFSRQEYWSRLPFPSPGDLPNPGIKLGSPALQADALSSEPPGKPFGGPALTRASCSCSIKCMYWYFPSILIKTRVVCWILGSSLWSCNRTHSFSQLSTASCLWTIEIQSDNIQSVGPWVRAFRLQWSHSKDEWSIHLKNNWCLTNNTKKLFQPGLHGGCTWKTELFLRAEITLLSVGEAALMHHPDPPHDE